MTQICTTIEQSKILQELGISEDTSDMFHPTDFSFPRVYEDGDDLKVGLPAWSLGALIGLLPDEVRNERFNVTYYLTIDKYGIWYSNHMENEENEYECYGDLFECCIEMIEALKLNFV